MVTCELAHAVPPQQLHELSHGFKNFTTTKTRVSHNLQTAYMFTKIAWYIHISCKNTCCEYNVILHVTTIPWCQVTISLVMMWVQGDVGIRVRPVFVYLSVCQNMCIYVWSSVRLSVRASAIWVIMRARPVYVCLFVCIFVCLFVCLSVYLYVHLSVYMSICLHICLFVCTFVCPSVYISVYQYVGIFVCMLKKWLFAR